MKRRMQSGQATIELAAILVGLAAIVLGMIFVAGICMGNNRTFLNSKLATETLSRSGSDSEPSEQKEFSYWVYTTFSNAVNTASSKVATTSVKQEFELNKNYEMYRYYDESKVNSGSERLTIPFLADDSDTRSNNNSIGKVTPYLNDNSTSDTTQYSYRWYSPDSFDSHLGQGYASITNGFVAANLITADSDGTSAKLKQMTDGYQDNASAKMYNAFYKWFGVQVSPDQLRKIPSNTTYMPNL